MVEHHALAEQNRHEGDPEIAGVDQLCPAEGRAQHDGEAGAEMAQGGGGERRPDGDDFYTGEAGDGCDGGTFRHGGMQPGLRGKGG